MIIPSAIIAGPWNVGELRKKLLSREAVAIGEAHFQYEGIDPGDARAEPVFALAEELDVPIGVHIGLGPPGEAYRGKFTCAAGAPLRLEPVLKKHPRLRVYVMHAGWPMVEEMLSILQMYPNVYVDIGAIDWFIPRREFHATLRRLVESGFSDRVMFGSDQMVWPGAFGVAVEAVQRADFLCEAQREAIFFGIAARFFRFEQVAAAR
jgi:predicted TIM-barrel fold metal-dependent hydrolase